MGCKLQVTGSRLQAASFRPPKPQAGSCRLQAAGYRLQAAGCRLQAAGYRLQATGHKQQGRYKLQPTSHRPQATGYKLQATKTVCCLYLGAVCANAFHHFFGRNIGLEAAAATLIG